ncbi:MAG: permease-like cell division protein FtsX [Saprospiraceae bacterium]|nr:permease-like cell division protein FtsX [Saprospiraceae bacterium]
MSTTATYRARVNYTNVIVSMALVLFMLGLFGYALLYGRQLGELLRESIDVAVELTENAEKAQADKLMEVLNTSEFVKSGSVQLISKEEAAKIMQAELDEDFAQAGLSNPYFDMVTFNVKADWMHPDSLAWIRTALREEAGVNDVFYQGETAELIASNIKKVAWGALFTALFFIFAAATLIHNTIRLALFANRFLIKNMELVGATWGFISRPYLLRAVWHGLLSGLIAVLGLYILHRILESSIPQWKALGDGAVLLSMAVGLVVLGVAVQWLSTLVVVRKYLRLRVDELF